MTPSPKSIRTRRLGRGSLGAHPTRLVDDPWGVELTDDQTCIAGQGARGSADGQAIVYYCGTTANGFQLLGTPSRAGPLWSYQAVRASGTGGYTSPVTVYVTTACFARP
jgi:hypothetical protein